MSESSKHADEMMSPVDLEIHRKGREKVFSHLIEALKPWLFEFGSWIFGGLIAFNLVILAPLLTVGPVHPAVLLSIAVFACALPLDVAGVFSLKLIKDMHTLALDEVMKTAFQNADLPYDEKHAEEKGTPNKRRTDVGLRYAVHLAAVSAALTLVGMLAALWYIAWWIAVIFAVMAAASLVITSNVLVGSMRPGTDAEKELRRAQPGIRQGKGRASASR